MTVYLAGSTTLATTYQDQSLTTANTNPITLDANGECLLWVDSAYTYKILLKDALGATVSGYPVDNIPGAADVGTAAAAAAAAAVAAAEDAVADAEAAAALAEAARDATLGYAKVYTTTAQGIAATTDGQQFLIRTSDLYTFQVYYNNATVATLLGSVTLANGGLIEETYSPLAWAVRDQYGNAAVGVESDGTVVAQKLRVNQLEAAMLNIGRYADLSNPDYAGGADLTGATLSDAVMTAALAAGYNTVVIPDNCTVKLSTGWTLADGMVIQGAGPNSILRWTSDSAMFTLGNRGQVRNLKIVGDGKASGKTLQCGVKVNAKTGVLMQDLWLEDIGGDHTAGGAGIVITDNVGTDREGARIVGIRLKSNKSGIALLARGEYAGLIDIDAFSNDTAIYTNSGNFRMAGMNVGNNTVGIEVATGTNDSHGTISHSLVNHNTTNLKVGAITQGLELMGSHFYSGNIEIAGATGVDFIGCHLAIGTLTLTGTCSVAIRGGRFPQSPDADAMTQTLNGNTIAQTATPFNF